MSIREAVVYLCEELKILAEKRESRLLPTIEAMSSIQNAEFECALDDWEDRVMSLDVPERMCSAGEKLNEAVQAVFDLGRCNMYSAYSTSDAEREYLRATSAINKLYIFNKRFSKFDLSEC